MKKDNTKTKLAVNPLIAIVFSPHIVSGEIYNRKMCLNAKKG